jgi:hypothetical protein
MVTELQKLPLPFILWQYGYIAPTHSSCNYANFREQKKNSAVSVSVCGLVRTPGASWKRMQKSDKLLVMRFSQKQFFLIVLGIQLRASCLLGECSTTWVMPPVLLLFVCLFFFQIRSCTFVCSVLNHDSPISVSWVAGITDACHLSWP